MRAATIVFIKETMNINDNYGKFIYFEMIKSTLKIKLHIIYSSEHTKWKHRILTLCISFWYLLNGKFMIPEVVFMAVQCLWPEVMLDQFRFLRNCLPTPPLTHVSALKSHVSEKHRLRVGWMSSFENVFLVFLFLFNILNLMLLFSLKIQWTFQSGTHPAGKQQDYLLREREF